MRVARETAEAHFAGYSFMDPGQRWGFERLLAWAKAQGIPVVAISYPLTREYLKVIQEELGDPGAVVRREVIDRLPEEHPEVLHLDFTNHFYGRDELFADPHHLNRAGRIAFTRDVHRALVEAGVL